MRAAWMLLATAAVAVAAWIAGEQHRGNCIRADRVQCSVLPWASGHARAQPGPTGFDYSTARP